MSVKEILKSEKAHEMYKNSGIRYLGLFGSFAREDNTKDSDVDLLVDFKKTKTLLQEGGVIVQFQDLLNRDIDLVHLNFIKPNRKPYIMQDLVTIYEEK